MKKFTAFTVLISVALLLCGFQQNETITAHFRAASGGGSPTFKQAKCAEGNTGALALTPGSNFTAGSRLVVAAYYPTSGLSTAPTDAGSDTFTSSVAEFNSNTANNYHYVEVWTVASTAGGFGTVTVNFSSSNFVGGCVLEFTGTGASLDQSANTANTSGPSVSVGPVTTTRTDACGTFWQGASGTGFTPTGSWQAGNSSSSLEASYQIQSVSGSITGTATAGADYFDGWGGTLVCY